MEANCDKRNITKPLTRLIQTNGVPSLIKVLGEKIIMKISFFEKVMLGLVLLFLANWFYLQFTSKDLPFINQAGVFLLAAWLVILRIQILRQIRDLKIEHSKEIFDLKLTLKQLEEKKDETPNKKNPE